MEFIAIDRLIVEFDKALRTLTASARSTRAVPGRDLPESCLTPSERAHASSLMRVNHVGEICAQALYQGQALTSRNIGLRIELETAAREETEHLAWTEQRIAELGGRKSVLNPAWYVGALSLGMLAGACGDRWNLGFLAETERQVGAHLEDHLSSLPKSDEKSRAIVSQMHVDELTHAATAVRLGANALPPMIRGAMWVASRCMAWVAYRL